MNHADINTALQNLLKGLYYVSESESPLELMDWDIKNDAELRSQIAAFTGQPESTPIQTEAAAFFDSIQRMADPADEAIMEYARRYSELQDFLQKNLSGLKVIKTGNVEVHIFIAGFTSDTHQAIVLHTIAIQT